jgi:hypothetical protein
VTERDMAFFLVLSMLFMWMAEAPRLTAAMILWVRAGIVYTAVALILVAIGALVGVYP